MKKNKIMIHIIWMIAGGLLIASGLFLLDDRTKNIAGLCIGVGSSITAINLINLVFYRYYKKHPELEKQGEIDARDERNISINRKAKSKAFDLTIKLLAAVPFLLILLDQPLWMILSVIGFYLLAYGIQFYYIIRYSNEM